MSPPASCTARLIWLGPEKAEAVSFSPAPMPVPLPTPGRYQPKPSLILAGGPPATAFAAVVPSTSLSRQ